MTDGLSKVSGQICTIDPIKRAVAIKDKEGIITTLTWQSGIDTKMQKLKERFFTTFLHIGANIDDVHYFAKPADWPVQQQSGKKEWHNNPKQDPAGMVVMGLHKNYTSLVTTSPDDFDNACDLILRRVEEDAPKLMALIKKLGGQ